MDKVEIGCIVSMLQVNGEVVLVDEHGDTYIGHLGFAEGGRRALLLEKLEVLVRG